MSFRWRAHLCVPALGIVLSASSANVADAQCSHGRQTGQPDPRLMQSLLQQQLLQQRQLQQIQHQQVLQMKFLEDQVRELAGQGREALKIALQDPRPEKRWAAVFVIGKDRLPLTDELIERLTDDNPFVRQAARQGLVRLSTTVGTREGKPSARRSVDFGPAPDANRTAQKAAARKWRTWFERQQARPDDPRGVAVRVPPASAAVLAKDLAVAPAPEEEAVRLSKELIQAPADRREAVLAKLRDRKGATYTQALAEAIPQLAEDYRAEAREALTDRMTRMTTATLGDKLRDADPEVRRAAALACAMKETAAHIPDLIVLLQDKDSAVPPAARAALKSLTSQDFGSVASRDPAGQARVAAAWKAWWQKQSGP
jgi:hypothetical protein